MDNPPTWCRKVLPTRVRPAFSGLWIFLLVLATIAMLIGLEMAIFGSFPGLTEPESIQNTAMLFVMAAAILYILSFIAGFGHELRKIEPSKQVVV